MLPSDFASSMPPSSSSSFDRSGLSPYQTAGSTFTCLRGGLLKRVPVPCLQLLHDGIPYGNRTRVPKLNEGKTNPMFLVRSPLIIYEIPFSPISQARHLQDKVSQKVG